MSQIVLQWTPQGEKSGSIADESIAGLIESAAKNTLPQSGINNLASSILRAARAYQPFISAVMPPLSYAVLREVVIGDLAEEMHSQSNLRLAKSIAKSNEIIQQNVEITRRNAEAVERSNEIAERTNQLLEELIAAQKVANAIQSAAPSNTSDKGQAFLERMRQRKPSEFDQAMMQNIRDARAAANAD